MCYILLTLLVILTLKKSITDAPNTRMIYFLAANIRKEDDSFGNLVSFKSTEPKFLLFELSSIMPYYAELSIRFLCLRSIHFLVANVRKADNCF